MIELIQNDTIIKYIFLVIDYLLDKVKQKLLNTIERILRNGYYLFSFLFIPFIIIIILFFF